jgi:cardiolipin synthase
VLDPLADKITQFTLIICLAMRHPVLWSLIGLFVAKELFQFVAGYIIVRHGRILKGAQITGKICTTVLFVSLTILVLVPDIHPNWVLGFTIADGLFLLIAFIDYIFVYVRKSEELTEELHFENEDK